MRPRLAVFQKVKGTPVSWSIAKEKQSTTVLPVLYLRLAGVLNMHCWSEKMNAPK